MIKPQLELKTICNDSIINFKAFKNNPDKDTIIFSTCRFMIDMRNLFIYYISDKNPKLSASLARVSGKIDESGRISTILNVLTNLDKQPEAIKTNIDAWIEFLDCDKAKILLAESHKYGYYPDTYTLLYHVATDPNFKFSMENPYFKDYETLFDFVQMEKQKEYIR